MIEESYIVGPAVHVGVEIHREWMYALNQVPYPSPLVLAWTSLLLLQACLGRGRKCLGC